ncbi:GNAT family N-acetyltransferase [Fictibacillus gelatini]|uniref:GNAT family N-acetyltransferase n=1 Tax=Fictibacillus gelatini TaxID=225985 RepID=UPI00040984C6|nr:GNAT family protein [Fictibacillus gelatini]
MRLEGERIYLRYYTPEDAKELVDLNIRNKEFFQQFSMQYEDSFYTSEFQENKIKEQLKEMEEDKRYTFGIFLKENDRLIGDITLAQVVRKHVQSSILGYALDQQYNGKGLMTEAVRLVVKFAFEKLKLHRITAGVSPRNPGSARVLEKAGFQREGLARKNVKINGKWEDHIMFAILEDDL